MSGLAPAASLVPDRISRASKYPSVRSTLPVNVRLAFWLSTKTSVSRNCPARRLKLPVARLTGNWPPSSAVRTTAPMRAASIASPWSTAQPFQTRIRRNVRLAEAPSFGQSIFQYAPGSNGAEDYRQLALEVLEQLSPDGIGAGLEAGQL